MPYTDLRPGQTCHSKDGGSEYWAWLKVWDKVKIPRYTHRLMHRKRVTYELHDSYFRLMTIKHAIPKTAEVTHSDGQSWGDIEWLLNYYITRWRLEVSEFGDQTSWRSDELETRCGRENSTQRRGSLGLQLSRPGERERHTAMSGRAGEVNMLQYLFSLQLPVTHNPFNKVRGIFSKRTESSSLLCRCYDFTGICVCMVDHGYTIVTYNLNSISFFHTFPKGISTVWFEFGLSCPFPMTITLTAHAHPFWNIKKIFIHRWIILKFISF